MLGEVGEGWAVAMTTLLHERGTLGFALTGALEVRSASWSRSRASAAGDDGVLRDRVAHEWIELQALRLTNYRSLTTLVKTGIPGPEGSVTKLHWSERTSGDEARARAARRRLAAPRRRRLLALPAAP